MNKPQISMQPQASGGAIARDFQNVVTDAQELLTTIGNEGDAQLTEAKNKVRRSLQETVKGLEALQASVTTGAKTAAMNTDAYVHDNPWVAVAIGTALGALAGYLIARR